MTINKIFCKSLWIQLFILSVMGMFVYYAFTYAEDAQEAHWMPDPALRESVREALRIPDGIPMLPADMLGLRGLVAEHDDIESLKGLEHAVNLHALKLAFNQISDISPLAGLVNLKILDLQHNQISDISPLAGLVNLKLLRLQHNQISDISPLAGLLGLQELFLGLNQISDISPLAGLLGLHGLALNRNQISDISPLAGLVNLKILNIDRNPILDFTPIYGLVGIERLHLGDIPIDSEFFERLNLIDRSVICEIAREPIHTRIENRGHPSIFQACGGIINLPELSWLEAISYHDLFFCGQTFNFYWLPTPDGNRKLIGHHENAGEAINEVRARNPNIILLTSIEFYGAAPDSLYALRDESGNVIIDHKWQGAFADFTQPALQDKFIQQAIDVAKCGYFDGIAIDHWNKSHGFWTKDQQEKGEAAKDRMIQGIRDAVGDDFLILVTTTNRAGFATERHAEYINGIFMETTEDYEGGYTYKRLSDIENTLLWAEENLREPQINCVAGRGVRNELLDSPRNLQWMRLWTTLNLTHSDGYVMFTMGGALDHPPHPFEFLPGHADDHTQGKLHTHQNHKYWYDFWDANLGRPIGGDETKAQLYKNREGLFIREFTNGWAVYNRSGKAQEIGLPIQTTGVESGVTSFKHTVPDLDGEMYLKTEVTADVNGDGVVNIQDLVIVANAFGEAEPDLNGDGVVNIQDLVIVANAF
ncbi:MAG: leucine-rich repeat domain-containing protein [Candidatus Poribacteria bacterium]|nr:leucine-rich repeat domain-containing protein [Candidatus Poribacteria bacterium]